MFRFFASQFRKSNCLLQQQQQQQQRRSIFAKTKLVRHTKIAKPFHPELGGELPELNIEWEQWGSSKAEQVVLICPSLSVGSHVCSTPEDPKHGWWQNIVGAGKAINTDQYRVICASNLGAPFGTTSPISLNPNTQQAYGASFPQITPRDIARVAWLLLDELGVRKLHAVVGASLGGCLALSVAAERPKHVDKLLAISCTAKASSGSRALRHVQREAIRYDPCFRGGNYLQKSASGGECRPLTGLRIARQLGMITYRSLEEFSQRFTDEPKAPIHFAGAVSFDVERYLQKKADIFARHYDANCFLLMSLASDLMDLSRGYETFAAGVGRIEAESLIIGVENDMIIPFTEQSDLHAVLHSLGRKTQLIKYSSLYGHDAFFVDDFFFGPKIRRFISGSLLDTKGDGSIDD